MRSLVMSLALLVLLTGCGSAVPRAASPSATSTPHPALTWRQFALPANASLMRDAGFTASSGASHIAWACAPDTHGAFNVWALHSPQGAWQ
ncbi:MAG TPA: hypothetical protein VF807_03730, partial [Ktedonobacterales bacterium]